MREAWKKKLIRQQRGSYQAATIEKIDTHWLIFDSQTDEALPFSEETFNEMDIQIQSAHQEWIPAYYYDDNYLRSDKHLIPLEDKMNIRIENLLPFAYQTWLEGLARNPFLKFTQFINDLNYSLFDCIYCHHTALFSSNENGHGVNFIFLDNGYLPCSIHHKFHFIEHVASNQFDFTLADGKSYHFII